MDSAVIVICLNRLNWRGVVHFADVSRQNDPSPGDSLDRGVFGNVQIPPIAVYCPNIGVSIFSECPFMAFVHLVIHFVEYFANLNIFFAHLVETFAKNRLFRGKYVLIWEFHCPNYRRGNALLTCGGFPSDESDLKSQTLG